MTKGMVFYKYNGDILKKKEVLYNLKCDKLNQPLSEVKSCPILNFDDTGCVCCPNMCEFAVKINTPKSSDSDK